jgi:hypothetical protein
MATMPYCWLVLAQETIPQRSFNFLIEAGSDVNSTAKDGMTALLYQHFKP